MNLDPHDQRGARNRLLVKLLGGLVVAGVVIGLVVGVLGTTMLRSMGLKEQSPPPSSASAPSDDSDESTEAGGDKSDPAEEDEESTEEDENDKRPQKPRTQLNAQPNPAEPGSEITLSGSFGNLNGGTLQVQRREGGDWTNFPVTASLNPNGTFSTYIITSRTGTSPYRLFHAQSGRSTPPVSIRID